MNRRLAILAIVTLGVAACGEAPVSTPLVITPLGVVIAVRSLSGAGLLPDLLDRAHDRGFRGHRARGRGRRVRPVPVTV